MTQQLMTLTHPSIRQLEPYQAGKPIEELQRELGLKNIIKLASNENPLGPSPKAVAAVQNVSKNFALYPDSNGFELKQALSEKFNITPQQITLGNGSDNLLSLIVQAFVEVGEEVLMSEYAFSVFSIATRAMRANPVYVTARNWGNDLNAILKAITTKTRVIMLANPNNPTGTYFSHDELQHFMQKVPGNVLVVMDEAYYEYAQHLTDYPNSLALQKNYPNLLITRTFSKAYGLAGLRIGYSITYPTIADILNRIRLAFNVSVPALAAATAALQDTEFLQQSLLVNQQGMQQLTRGFEEIGLTYIPSTGNFITINVNQNALAVYQALLHEGIIVRPLVPYNMPQHLRISIGLPDENTRLLTALRKILCEEKETQHV